VPSLADALGPFHPGSFAVKKVLLPTALLTAAALLVSAGAAPAQEAADLGERFAKTEAMIPMRDGIRLNTAIYVPRKRTGPLPFILLRTPYGIDDMARRSRSQYLKHLEEEGYLFVLQDIRGRFKSEGQFVMNRSPRDHADPKAIDESTDAFDTIAWLLKNVPDNNGRVGMLGISYGGWLTAMAMLDPHPALKAVSPQASPADQFLGDDFHHNGAFRLSYGFEYVAMMETSKVNVNFQFDRHDTYEWYLKLGPLANVNAKYFHGERPTWNDFIAHPTYDAFWQKEAFAPYLNRVTVPTLNVAGWWDQEDFYGALKIYELLEKHDAKDQNYLVVGPWNHGGWANGRGDSLGNIHFDSSTGKYFREKVQAPWFAHFLKDKGDLAQPEALVFETGSNRWASYDHWPPRRRTTDRKLYLHAGGRLAFEPPSPGPGPQSDSYTSDPANPVPYRPRPVPPTYPGPQWREWLVQDQRFVHRRPDVLSWETEPLEEDVVVAGDVRAHLFASTTGTDSDWVVKLIDVYPEEYPDDPSMGGYQLMIAGEVFRGRFRKSFEKPEPLVPDEVNEYGIGLHWTNHCFRKGHKIMVQVQSTWFPVIDRNPQKYVENIFKAEEEDFQLARQQVFRSPKWPSHVVLPVLRTAGPKERGASQEERK
jgi:putative CocE/NonD family hydrolase